MRITHPFHPLSGQQFVCVGERYNRYGTRILLALGDNAVCAIPPQWTDLVAPDPEIVISAGRSPFRVGDLLELADHLTRLGGHSSERTTNDV